MYWQKNQGGDGRVGFIFLPVNISVRYRVSAGQTGLLPKKKTYS
jgi:hypothetical protein